MIIYLLIGIAPAEMFFKLKLRTRLPDISLYGQEEVDIKQVIDNDLFNKFKTKQLYIGSKRHTRERKLEVGDRVLLRQRKPYKLDTPYDTVSFD